MDQDKNSRPMKDWSLSEWNRRLVAGILREVSETGSYEPIHNLIISRESLARAVSSEAAPASVIRTFIDCLRRHLNATRRALDVDGTKLAAIGAWLADSDVDPPFWAHLVFTCFVANAPEVSNDHDFRRRMKVLLGRDQSLQLVRLPRLWEDVATWTKLQQRGRKACRELILPPPGWRRLIGYSLLLAFPSRKDNETLIRILAAADLLEVEPPVRPTMELIQMELHNFSERFRQEYGHLRQRWQGDPMDIQRNQLWAAIREASLYGRHAVRAAEPGFGLAMSLDADGFSSCWVTSDRPFSQKGWFTVWSDLFGSEIFLVHFKTADLHGAHSATARYLAAAQDLPIAVKGLSRAIEDGVLLFEQSAPGFFTWRSTYPEREQLLFLVRMEMVKEFTAVFGGQRLHSPYGEWRIVEGVTRSAISKAQKTIPRSWEVIRSLQPTAPLERISISGRFYADSGTSIVIGMPELLPVVRIQHADSVVAEGSEANVRSVQVRLVPDSSDEWTFPPTVLDGDYTVVAFRRKAAFRVACNCLFEAILRT